MTIETTVESQLSNLVEKRKTRIGFHIIFFSSGNPPWCPDCVDSLDSIRNVFQGEEEEAVLALVDRIEWRKQENEFRKVFKVNSIPTVVKWVDGKEVARLDEPDCKDEAKLRRFVKG